MDPSGLWAPVHCTCCSNCSYVPGLYLGSSPPLSCFLPIKELLSLILLSSGFSRFTTFFPSPHVLSLALPAFIPLLHP